MKLTIGNLKYFHVIVSEYTYDLYEVKVNQKTGKTYEKCLGYYTTIDRVIQALARILVYRENVEMDVKEYLYALDEKVMELENTMQEGSK